MSVDPQEALIRAYSAKYLGCASQPDPVPEAISQLYVSTLRASLGRVFNAQGTGFTAANALACAAAVDKLTCDALASADGPPEGCRFTGTQASGAPCLDDSQCQSGYCRSGGGIACGTCVTPATAGQACSDVSPCARGYACGAGRCVLRGDVGAACDANRPCKNTLSCQGGLCASTGKQGDLCGGNRPSCGLSLSCQTNICTPLKRAGETCDPMAVNKQCSQFYLCDAAERKCVTPALAKIGDSCAATFCTEGYCDPNKRCVAFIQDGQPCDANGGGCGLTSTCQATRCTRLPSCP